MRTVRTKLQLRDAIRAGIAVRFNQNNHAAAHSADVKPDTVCRWTRGENTPGALELAKLALALNQSMDSLVYDVSPKPLPTLMPAVPLSFTDQDRADIDAALRAMDELLKLATVDGKRKVEIVRAFCAVPVETLRIVEAQRKK